MTETTDARRLARITGLLYLVIIVAAGFAEGFVRTTLVVPGDPAGTAAAILDSPGLFRLGFLADLTAFLADTAVSVLLYLLLRPTSRSLAMAAAAFRLIAHPAIGSLNLLNYFAPILLLGDAGVQAGLDPAQAANLAALALTLHGYGYVLAGAFFGVHCALLGVLLWRSPLFPRVLGVLLGAAGVGYLFEVIAVFGLPSFTSAAEVVVVATAAVGEVGLCLYLLVRGVRSPPSAASSATLA